jgi:hypothetical protein
MRVVPLASVRPGYVLAPAAWEVGYANGRSGVLPWAEVIRPPIVLRMAAPGMKGPMLQEAKVACRTPTGEVMYYTGKPSELVRIILPPGVSE